MSGDIACEAAKDGSFLNQLPLLLDLSLHEDLVARQSKESSCIMGVAGEIGNGLYRLAAAVVQVAEKESQIVRRGTVASTTGQLENQHVRLFAQCLANPTFDTLLHLTVDRSLEDNPPGDGTIQGRKERRARQPITC